MDLTSFAATPPTADTEPGDLYCDLQSRTLWLGVDNEVDPAGAVLISDIVGVLAEIDAAETAANSYTDSKVSLLAPKASPVFTGNPSAPTPAVGDNDTSIATTAFVKTAVSNALASGNFVAGMIMMWSGALSSPPAGWALCDGGGSPPRPDLRDKFILAASATRGVGSVNPATSATTDNDGAHTPTITPFALTTAHMPAHSHSFSDTTSTTSSVSIPHTHSATLNGTTDTEPAHVHAVGSRNDANGFPASIEHSESDSGSSVYSTNTSAAGAHAHTVQVSGNTGAATSTAHTHTVAVSGTTSSIGSGAAHTHVMGAVGAHNHAVTSTNLRNAIPYYALAFIIKL